MGERIGRRCARVGATEWGMHSARERCKLETCMPRGFRSVRVAWVALETEGGLSR